MPFDTYANLQTTVSDWLDRDDIDDNVPDFITLAESEMNLKFTALGAPRYMITRGSATIDDEFETTPTDFLGAVSVIIDGSTEPLTYLSPDKINEYKASYSTDSGNPQVYTVVGNEFQFWPAPTASVNIEFTYIQRIPALSDSNTSNWVLELYPAAYLYGSLIQSAPFLKDDARINTWQGEFDKIISAITVAGQRGQTAYAVSVPFNPAVV